MDRVAGVGGRPRVPHAVREHGRRDGLPGVQQEVDQQQAWKSAADGHDLPADPDLQRPEDGEVHGAEA